MKDFVQDLFFEKGHLPMKIREVFVTLLYWIFLVLPILILFNSVSPHVIWQELYHWTYRDGFELTRFIELSILVAFLIILAFSIFFLLRNNYFEKHIYPNQLTYDEDELKLKKEILEKMYEERFGDKEFRESAKYYAVEGEQNLENGFVDDLLKKGGTTRSL